MKKYKKIIDGRTVIKPRNKIVVVKEGLQVINPKEATLLADGWEVYKTVESAIAEIDPQDYALGKLGSSDYKIIKCMEAYLCGEPLPYDIIELHKERDAEREIVNNNESK